MLFLAHILYALIAIAAIIYTCSLFTNAIEHLGSRLKLGSNAIGAVLAVIGTTLPETIVPLVALVGAYALKLNIVQSQNIAIGAIFGSPFILSTLALFMLGVVLLFKKRDELKVDYKTILRNYKYFFIAYTIAICASFLNSKNIQALVVCFLLALYIIFATRTINKSKENFSVQELDELTFKKFFKKDLLFLQIVISLFGLIVSSHFFIDEIKFFSEFLNINPLILSLFITPVATELPECVNSIIWLKQDKDELAIANVLGAIVFQAVVPVSIGILLTPWQLNKTVLINAVLVFICMIFFTLSILITKKIKTLPLLGCGLFYFSYLIWAILK